MQKGKPSWVENILQSKFCGQHQTVQKIGHHFRANVATFLKTMWHFAPKKTYGAPHWTELPQLYFSGPLRCWLEEKSWLKRTPLPGFLKCFLNFSFIRAIWRWMLGVSVHLGEKLDHRPNQLGTPSCPHCPPTSARATGNARLCNPLAAQGRSSLAGSGARKRRLGPVCVQSLLQLHARENHSVSLK